MKRFLACAAVSLAMFQFSARADVLIDDFMNRFTGGASGDYNQSDLGEAYGVASQYQIADSGNGWWSISYDPLGTKMTNGNGDSLSQDSALPNSVFPVDPVENKPVMHVIMHPELSTGSDFDVNYPYADVQVDLPGGDSTYFDLTKMTAIAIKVKGVAPLDFRLRIQTKKLLEITGPNDTIWGFHYADFSVDTTWIWDTIMVSQFRVEQDGLPLNDTPWDSVKAGCKSITIEANTGNDLSTTDSAELFIDSLVLVGVDYSDLGFAYPSKVRFNKVFSIGHTYSLTASVADKMMNISYSLKTAGNVAIDLLSASGRRVMSLVRGTDAANGIVSKTFSTGSLSAGAYFIRANLGGTIINKKVTIVK